MKFTHLHVHSHYSLLDGLPKIDQLLDYCQELGMDSIALTDHGAMYGIVEFYQKAKARNIKPILGCEVYTALESMKLRRPNIDDKRYHLTLLAKNKTGYQNLIKIVTRGYLEGFYYKMRVDKKLLAKYSQGLICLSGCLEGEVSKSLANKDFKKAEKTVLEYQKIFGQENFYLEIMDHPNLPQINPDLIKLSKKTKAPLVATNDAHYLRKQDAEAQDLLLCVQTNKTIHDQNRLTMLDGDYSLRQPKQMIESFKQNPEAILNTQEIVKKCNFELELGKIQLPHFKAPKKYNLDSYLEKLAKAGLKKRYKKITKKIQHRFNYELEIIKQTGFASYFLIVADFVNWAKNNSIAVGPGRGSCAGSLVSYVLNITDIDPLKYNLLFERFLSVMEEYYVSKKDFGLYR